MKEKLSIGQKFMSISIGLVFSSLGILIGSCINEHYAQKKPEYKDLVSRKKSIMDERHPDFYEMNRFYANMLVKNKMGYNDEIEDIFNGIKYDDKEKISEVLQELEKYSTAKKIRNNYFSDKELKEIKRNLSYLVRTSGGGDFTMIGLPVMGFLLPYLGLNYLWRKEEEENEVKT